MHGLRRHLVYDVSGEWALRQKGPGITTMNGETIITGAIIDSWVEPAGSFDDRSRLVLNVALSHEQLNNYSLLKEVENE